MNSDRVVGETPAQMENRKQAEREAMLSNLAGRALLLVQEVLQVQRRLESFGKITAVGQDDMVFLARRLMSCQESFRSDGKPTHVILGYHYTSQEYMDSIREHGLMSRSERQERAIHTKKSKTFGDGIYTATNPFAFYGKYGDVGIVVAILQGKTKRVSIGEAVINKNIEYDTFVGNKRGSDCFDEIVLRKSSQCLPLVRFSMTMLSSHLDVNNCASALLWKFHLELQKIMDEFFNGGAVTQPMCIMSAQQRSSVSQINNSHTTSLTHQMLALQPNRNPVVSSSSFPATSRAIITSGLPPTRHEALYYEAPNCLTDQSMDCFVTCKSGLASECPICFDSLKLVASMPVQLVKCKHVFHRPCIERYLEVSSKCPVCRVNVREPQGYGPSGAMRISLIHTPCSGHELCSTIQIIYSMPSGTQLAFHDNPGRFYSGTQREAYLPDNDDGKKLLKRLKYAWMHGLTFTIGTSLTTGVSNSIVWSSIHHKTSKNGGVHGFPDGGYFVNCNADLDALGVPHYEACSLKHYYEQTIPKPYCPIQCAKVPRPARFRYNIKFDLSKHSQ